MSTTGHNADGISGTSGGTTTITSSGAVSTTGNYAVGISGAGYAGMTIVSSGAVSTTGFSAYGISGSANGSMAIASITSSGAISTTGESAYGIFGINYGGNTTITSSGAVSTTGRSAAGILGVGSGDTTITSSGAVSTIGVAADGISGRGGNTTITVTDTGSVSSTGAASSAIYARAIDTSTVNNSGTVSGNVYMFGATVAFNNLAGSVFNAAANANLSGGTLTNAGSVSPGGNGTIQTTTLSGNYVQTSTGVLRVDADWTGNSGAGAADKLVVTGTAVLAGTVIVNPLNYPTMGGLTKQFTVLTAGGGITNAGISIANTAAVNYALLYPDANTMNVQATINFQGVGLSKLTPNQNAVGGNLNAILGGGTTLGFMSALTELPSGGALGSALNQLAPLGSGGQHAATLAASNTFASHLLSCRMAGEEGDATRFIKEGQCVWARVSARRFSNDGRADGVGSRENGTLFSAGAQMKVAPGWHIGGGVGYGTSNLSTNSNAVSTGERLHLGGVTKYNPGPLMLAATATGGFGWHDNVRHVSFGGFGATATSSNESSFASGRLTAAYLLSRGALYLKPQVELAATQLMRGGYAEQGAGGIALRVARSSDTVLSASPSVELGVEQRGVSGFVTRAFVKAGATVRDSDTFITTATFADAPAGSSPFAISSRIDKVTADIGAGLDLISAGDTALRIQYDGQLGSHTSQHSGGAKLSVKF